MTHLRPEQALALLRAAQNRAFEREGVPMVLALVADVDPAPVADETALSEGARLAQRLDGLWRALAARGRDADMGRVVTVLQAASYADFGRPGASS